MHFASNVCNLFWAQEEEIKVETPPQKIPKWVGGGEDWESSDLSSSWQKTWNKNIRKYSIGMEQERSNCFIQHSVFHSSPLPGNPFYIVSKCIQIHTLFVEQVVKNLPQGQKYSPKFELNPSLYCVLCLSSFFQKCFHLPGQGLCVGFLTIITNLNLISNKCNIECLSKHSISYV